MPIKQFIAPELLHGGMVIWLIIALALVCYWLLFEALYQHVSKQSHDWFYHWQKPLQIMVSAMPLLGLLGTVLGLLDIFSAMAANAKVSMSDGIGKALLTTQMGLLMTIPALLILCFLQRQLATKTEAKAEAAHAP